ncbi:MAG: hypothetical protein IJP80_05790 [Bacteroidales bacterium]|nr:hypothetical protein [Bacteroidales bacterium]
MTAINKWASAVKLLSGAVFIISALSKLVTVDSFEMYVYSFGLFPMVPCFYLTRLLIGAELLLGVSLISHRNHRFTTITSLLFLLFFIVFLVYAQMIGRTDSCHCFGDLLPFNPVQSMLKNAVMILLLLFVYKYGAHEWHPRWWLVVVIYLVATVAFAFFSIRILHALDFRSLVLMAVALAMGLLASFPFYSRWWVTTPLVLAPFVATFILSPPDNWFHHEGNARFDKELFLSQIKGEEQVGDSIPLIEMPDGDSDTVALDELATLGLESGKHLVAFFSPTCGFCRLAAEKITTIAKRYDVDSSMIMYVFPNGFEQEKYDDFYRRANSCVFGEARIDRDIFIRITRASFPGIVLVDDGEIVASYAYRSIDEKTISEFLTK